MSQLFDDKVPYPTKKDWVRLNSKKMIEMVPVELSLQHGYPLTVRALATTDELSRQRMRVIEELTRKQQAGEPIPVTVEGYADSREFLILARYSSETGSILLTISRRNITDPATGRSCPAAVTTGWMRFHQKKKDLIPVRFLLGQSSAEPFSQLDAALTLTAPQLDEEMRNGQREMQAIQQQQEWMTVYREGITERNATVTFVGKTGWLPGVVPVENVFSPQDALQNGTAFLWLIYEAGTQLSIRVNDWAPFDGRPSFTARMDIPADRFVEKQQAARADIQTELGDPDHSFSVTVENVPSNGQRILVRYARPDGSWVAGYIPWNFIGPQRASRSDRWRWINQSRGQIIRVSVYGINPYGKDAEVIFGWDDPEADLQFSGQEEAISVKEEMTSSEFADRYQARLNSASLEYLDYIKEQAKGVSAVSVIQIPDRFLILTQGEELYQAATQNLRQPEGNSVRLVPAMLSNNSRPDAPALILKNAGMDTEPENPGNLPVLAVWPNEVASLDPLSLIARIVASRLDMAKSRLLGQMLMTDSTGTTYLVLFS